MIKGGKVMKKNIFMSLSFLLILTILLTTGCAGTNEQTTTQEQSVSGEPNEVKVSIFKQKEISQDFNDELFINYIKEKFNMILDYEYSSYAAYKDKINILFATGQYPQVVEFIDTPIINRLARDGFMIPLSDYIDRLTNYKNAFKPDDWDLQVKAMSNAAGKWYVLESKYAESALSTNIWMYRIKEFEKLNIPLPKTTEDLYMAMKKFKEVNPNATIPNRWGVWNAISGFDMAFRVQTGIWFDPDEKMLVYGSATEKYRELMKFMNKLFKEGILAKEFATMADEQRANEFIKGNVYVNFQFPGAENVLNEWMKSGNLEPDWGWEKDSLLLTAYPDKKPMQQKWKVTMDSGVGLTDKLKGEALDRFIDYVNWSCSEEGQIFHEFGIKGVTYDIIDGIPQYIGKAKDEADPNSYLGLIENFGPFGYYLIQNEDHAARCFPLNAKINEYTEGLEYFDYRPVICRFTPDEEDTISEVGVLLQDITDEYMVKFIMGTKDPNSDKDWNEYIDKIKSAGYDNYIKIYREAYSRVNK